MYPKTLVAALAATLMAGCSQKAPTVTELTPDLESPPLLVREEIVVNESGRFLLVQLPITDTEPELVFDDEDGSWTVIQPIGSAWPEGE